MSIEALNWALGLEIQPSARKFVLVVLCNYSSANYESYPSQEWLAKKTGQGERAVRTHLAELEKSGLIKRTARRTKNGVSMSHLYQILMPQENIAARQPPADISAAPPANSAANTKEDYTKAEREAPSSLFPEPPKPKEKKNARPGKTELPFDFTPDGTAYHLAAQLKVDINVILGEFKDWCASKRPRYADWQATFRNSIRRASRSRGGSKGWSNGQRRDPQSITDAALRAAARHSTPI